MILHTVNQSHSSILASCLRVATDNSSVLLIEDGVYEACISTQSNWNKANPTIKRYVLREDLDARGLLDKVSSHFTIVDYAGFVKLSTEHHSIQSWF